MIRHKPQTMEKFWEIIEKYNSKNIYLPQGRFTNRLIFF